MDDLTARIVALITHPKISVTEAQTISELTRHVRTVALKDAAEAVAYLRYQEVEPYDGRTLGAAVRVIEALKK